MVEPKRTDRQTKRRAMQRIVALLTGFGLENLGAHALQAWLEVCREKQRGTAHLRKADNHRKGVVMEAAFLSWRVQAAPLSEADHLKALGRGRDDVWDKDYDSDDNPTELHATILVRRTRAMFDGRDPDSDDETRDDVEAAKKVGEARFINWHITSANACDFIHVIVDTSHIKSEFRKTSTRYQPNIACSNYRDFHCTHLLCYLMM